MWVYAAGVIRYDGRAVFGAIDEETTAEWLVAFLNRMGTVPPHDRPPTGEPLPVAPLTDRTRSVATDTPETP